MSKKFFPPRPAGSPVIYAYELPGSAEHKGLLKIGFTLQGVQKRVEQQLKTAGMKYNVVLERPAMRANGSGFTDHDIHKKLREHNIPNVMGEWFRCKVKDVERAILEVASGVYTESERTQTFTMRPEQKEAVIKTSRYFRTMAKTDPERIPHFLWNAKMRFGKTFASYQLAKEMGWKKILVMTFKPAVQSAWEEDLKLHVDFSGWQFTGRNGIPFSKLNKSKPIVCFGSFQDFLGRNREGGIKPQNEWVHAFNWDCVILDEYHYGAWRENAKDLFEAEDKNEKEFGEGAGVEYFDESIMPITTNAYLYLSGTPFRAIASGEFIEEQIFNWTYSDEQRAKENWKGDNNPYEALPRMVLLTYQLPETIKEIARKGEFDEFDLNVFFSAKGEGKKAEFIYKDEVQKWLDLLRGSLAITTIDNLKLGAKKPPLPFSDKRLKGILSHTFWFLPSVASCHAMKNLLSERQNIFYHEYTTVVAAGTGAGIGVDALEPVLEAMENPLESKSITLSCGKLTTGVTVKPWTGIFMLRNTSSPETYFQAAFRVQSPWTITNPDGKNPNQIEILKKECYIFDFAPDRALRQIADYSCRLNTDETSPELKVEEFISFLPVLAYDGSTMKQIDARGILDMAMSGTTATLLARRWESALLVNVDNDTLKRLLNNKELLAALEKVEAFRALNQDLETIINKSENINKLKKKSAGKALTPKEKKELSEEEKKYKSKRKEVQEKLIKFATRIPVFMYLTDYREQTLKDVITKLEPELFRKVTGLTIRDFEMLVGIGLFNSGLMNDAIYKFKRYEDASLEYIGINKHNESKIGLYDTVISRTETNFVNEE